MTELNAKNRESYLEICKNLWDLDEQSLEYISKRTSDDWEPVPELKSLIGLPDSTYEDQRIRFNMDMSNPNIQSFFEKDDQAYQLFRNSFRNVLGRLQNDYSCNIGYKEFIENKAIFKKNQTKIKKIFETVYAERHIDYERDSGGEYEKESCADWIVRKFERIGASKKSAKKLQFVISFNPMDWFLASTAESFSSCFNLNNDSGGFQYCLGLPFLCGDKNRMMLYITNGAQKEFMGIKVDSVQTRTWCILDRSGNYNIVKWYPNDTVGTSPVAAITGVNAFKNRESFGHSKYPLDIISTKKGAVIGVYSDMGELKNEDDKLWLVGSGKTGQQIFTKNLINVSGRGRSSFTFSDEMPYLRMLGLPSPKFRIQQWKKIGVHLDMFFPTLRCSSCGEEKGGFVLRNDNGYLCYDCYKDNVFVCDCCSSEFAKQKDGSVPPIVESTEGKKLRLCHSCYSQIAERTCECCGKYSISSLLKTKEGGKVCKTCVEVGRNGLVKCEGCSMITNRALATYNEFTRELHTNCSDCSSNSTEMLNQNVFGRLYRIRTVPFGRQRGNLTLE